MLRATVVGNVWSTRRLPEVPAGALLDVETDTGARLVALDVLGCGVGEQVIHRQCGRQCPRVIRVVSRQAIQHFVGFAAGELPAGSSPNEANCSRIAVTVESCATQVKSLIGSKDNFRRLGLIVNSTAIVSSV